MPNEDSIQQIGADLAAEPSVHAAALSYVDEKALAFLTASVKFARQMQLEEEPFRALGILTEATRMMLEASKRLAQARDADLPPLPPIGRRGVVH